MRAFTQHPREQGISYTEHWAFAMDIAWRLLSSMLAFAIHAMMPFISIKRHLDLEATAVFLAERNRLIVAAAAKNGNVRFEPQMRTAPETASP